MIDRIEDQRMIVYDKKPAKKYFEGGEHYIANTTVKTSDFAAQQF